MKNKLHIGCFNKVVEGWHNTDVTPHLVIARIPALSGLLFRMGKMNEQRYEEHKSGLFKKVHRLNVGKRFPFEDNSFEAVFSSHVIEHLMPKVAVAMLEESFRILDEGGICRVVAPSLEYAVGLYEESDPEKMLDKIFESKHADIKIVTSGCTPLQVSVQSLKG